jgi:phosphoserine phosphatase
MTATAPRKHYLVASDFDQTLSFNDSGAVLSEIIGASGFEKKVAGLAHSNLVQQGAELAYLIRHDPDFRGVRREHLVEAGRRVRLRADIPRLLALLETGIPGYRFSYYVVSAAPRDVVESALSGIVAPDHIFGTELDFDPASGEVRSVVRVPAGYGKVSVLEELGGKLGVSSDRTIYVGDGSSDVHVMLHVNNGDGFTIAVSENRHLARIARRTVLSENAVAVALPVLEDIAGLRAADIRSLCESYGLALDGWEKQRAERVTISSAPGSVGARVA